MPDDEKIYDGSDAGLGSRLTKAIKHAIFGGGDVNLPDENPRKGTPADAGRVQQHSERQMNQTLDRLRDFGRRVQGNTAVQDEIKKAKQREGMSEEEATRKALGHQ